MPGGEDHSVSWRWAKPPREGSTCVIQALERRKTAMLSGRRGVPGRGEGLKRLEYNTDSICLNLNETSPASTSQPGSGSGVPSIQVLASKSPLWFFFLYIFLNSFFSFFLLPFSLPLSGKRCTTLAGCHAHVCLPLHPRLPLFPISLGNSAENN